MISDLAPRVGLDRRQSSVRAPRYGFYPTVFALFLLSGATGLIYEVVWLRLLVLIFGSTQFATSTILSTFMAGLALGAFVAGRLAKPGTAAPLRVYGLLEIGIGLYALAVPFLFRSLTPFYQWIWDAGASESFLVLSLAKFVGIAAVLLPPTVLMGASLPVLARQVADDPERIGGEVGGLYAINIFGAVAGVFLAGFVAIPTIGAQFTIWITAAANLLIGLSALLLARRLPAPAADTLPPSAGGTLSHPRSTRVRIALVVFGLSGFGALVLEVAWTRVLGLVLGSSVYAFALMLLAFLIGLAVGGAFFSALLRRRTGIDPAILLAALLGGSGLLAFGSAYLFGELPRLVAEMLIRWDPGPLGWFTTQFVAGMLVMFPATFALGGIFPAVLQLHARSLEEVSGSVGTVYAANTVGTILGAAAGGFVLIPQLGVLNTVVLIAWVQVLLGLVVLWTTVLSASAARLALGLPALLLLGAMAVARPGWDALVMNSGPFNLFGEIEENTSWEEYRDEPGKTVLLYEAEGLTAHVFVADEPAYDNRYLSINGKTEASTRADLETQLLSAHLPLLLHDDPRDVLVIGLASGITAGAAATHPSVEQIRILEIEEKVIPAARLFDEQNGFVLDDPRVTLSINDARNELEFSSREYDVIISEPSNPWMTIAANLFTEDFFRAARRRIRPGGVYCQWVQNYYLSTADLRSVIAAFQSAFPEVLLFETVDGVDLLLLGSQEPLRIDLEKLDRKVAELDVRMDLARVGMSSAVDILTTFRLGDREVRRLVRNAPRNTDDNARVEFNAPKSMGAETIGPNISLLRQFGGDIFDYIEPPVDDPARRDELRLALAERMYDRGDFDLALRAASEVSDGPFRARAEALLAALAERGPDI